MIDARELRINNLVEYLGETKKVLGFDDETVYLKNTVSVFYIELYEIYPIPLTEEWLLKFGFLKTNGYGFKMFGNWLQKEDDVYWYNVNGNFVEIKHVHQLQNLYFALTKKELVLQE